MIARNVTLGMLYQSDWKVLVEFHTSAIGCDIYTAIVFSVYKTVISFYLLKKNCAFGGLSWKQDIFWTYDKKKEALSSVSRLNEIPSTM